jgi:diguanylate cyclase (GGDEF)-like protein
MTPIFHDLRQIELFRDVPTAIIERILSEAMPQELAAGQVLLSPERENHHLYLLLSGLLTVHFGTCDSAPIREIHPGLSVGEMSIIDPVVPSAYVVAKSVSTVLPIHRDLIESVMADVGPMARNLLRSLAVWMKANAQRIVTDRGQIEELTDHAYVDGLTQLYNRRWLDNALVRLHQQSVGAEGSLCILLIDVDHFKKYNDSQGHLGGDQALIAIGQVLKKTLRPFDFATRYGGEEFLVLLPNIALSDAIGVAERIRVSVEKRRIAYPDGRLLPGVTISVGLACSQVDSTAQTLIAAADSQLYLAKTAGRNCVRYEASV